MGETAWPPTPYILFGSRPTTCHPGYGWQQPHGVKLWIVFSMPFLRAGPRCSWTSVLGLTIGCCIWREGKYENFFVSPLELFLDLQILLSAAEMRPGRHLGPGTLEAGIGRCPVPARTNLLLGGLGYEV